jgi:hypothetical protein
MSSVTPKPVVLVALVWWEQPVVRAEQALWPEQRAGTRLVNAVAAAAVVVVVAWLLVRVPSAVRAGSTVPVVEAVAGTRTVVLAALAVQEVRES